MRENLAHVFQEQAELFFDSQADSYAIMQLDSSKVTPFEPFSALRLLEKYGLKPNAEHYNIVYTDTLPAYQNIHVFLESVYSRSIPIPHKSSNGLASTSILFPVCRRA